MHFQSIVMNVGYEYLYVKKKNILVKKYFPKQHLFASIVLTCVHMGTIFLCFLFHRKIVQRKNGSQGKSWWRWNRLRLVFNDLKVLVNIYRAREKKILYFYPSKCKNCCYKIWKIKNLKRPSLNVESKCIKSL